MYYWRLLTWHSMMLNDLTVIVEIFLVGKFDWKSRQGKNKWKMAFPIFKASFNLKRMNSRLFVEEKIEVKWSKRSVVTFANLGLSFFYSVIVNTKIFRFWHNDCLISSCLVIPSRFHALTKIIQNQKIKIKMHFLYVKK